MTPQEQEMLDGLIGRVQSAQLTSKDGEADRLIQEKLARDPNALYILCQTVLLQGYALEQAQKQISNLKEQAAEAQRSQQPQHEPSFLEKIFGRSDPEPANTQALAPAGTPVGGQTGYGSPVYNEAGQGNPPLQGQAQYGQPAYGQPGYGQPGYTRPGYGQPQAAYPAPAYPMQPGYGTPYAPYGSGAPMGAGGGFLQGALQTAAGVALGELAFQSVEDLFRGFGHAAGYGSDRAVGFGDVGASGGGDYGDGGGFFSREQAENGVNNTLSSDIEDRRGDAGRNFADGGNSADSFAGSGDNLATDSGYDVDNSVTEADGSDFTDGNSGFGDTGDSSSFDGDSGSFDDGGGSFDDGGGSFDDN